MGVNWFFPPVRVFKAPQQTKKKTNLNKASRECEVLGAQGHPRLINRAVINQGGLFNQGGFLIRVFCVRVAL